MQQSYLECINKLKDFRENINTKADEKRAKLYFLLMKEKTKKIENEHNEKYVFENVVKYVLDNYKIDQYVYEKLNLTMKNM